MQVFEAEYAGACFGVSRALELAYKAADSSQGRVYMLGPLIHNPLVVKDLERRGVRILAEKDIPLLKDIDYVIVRTHGISRFVMESLLAHTSHVIDATCPFVTKAKLAAQELAHTHEALVIVGESEHPETLGIAGYVENAWILQKDQRIPAELIGKDIGVMAQTTQSLHNVKALLAQLEKIASHVTFLNTICCATKQRQNAAEALAQKVNIMVVIGGKNSANTRHLVEICKKHCETYHIEGVMDLFSLPLAKHNSVGITAGASTPLSHVKEVHAKIEKM